jgi:hypothetical protein
VIRRGLLEEKYNLNHKDNMIILPLDSRVAEAIGLPRHRHTPGICSHRTYSDGIRRRLNEVFYPIRQVESAHKKLPDYKKCRKGIERVSKLLRRRIVQAGGDVSLNEAFASREKSSL